MKTFKKLLQYSGKLFPPAGRAELETQKRKIKFFTRVGTGTKLVLNDGSTDRS
jgi:hypothetical protein